MFVSKNAPWVILLRLNGSLSVPVGVYLCIFILCIFFFFLLILIPSRRTQKTIQFKRPELPACHLAVTLNRLCSEWAVFFHTRKHRQQDCCSILTFRHERGRKKKGRGEEELSKKYCSNKIFLLLWNPPLLIQHQEKWSGKGLLLVPIQKGDTQRRERDLFPLGRDRKQNERRNSWRKTFKCDNKKWTTDDCKRAAVWVSGRIQLQTEKPAPARIRQYVRMHVDFDQTALLVGAD